MWKRREAPAGDNTLSPPFRLFISLLRYTISPPNAPVKHNFAARLSRTDLTGKMTISANSGESYSANSGGFYRNVAGPAINVTIV